MQSTMQRNKSFQLKWREEALLRMQSYWSEQAQKQNKHFTCPTPATRNCPDFAKAKEFTNPTYEYKIDLCKQRIQIHNATPHTIFIF